jgi:outer membrane protein assembly factor BamD
MHRNLIYIILVLLLTSSCIKKKKVEVNIPISQEKAYEIYREAVNLMNGNQLFLASKKFSEAEMIMPKIEFSAKASLMSSYCLYTINFYDEAITNLERFINKYPANKNIAYAHYIIVLSVYEQILDDKKDIEPALVSKKKIQDFIKKFPNTEYTLDLKFKLDLVNNQLAAKELYVAKHYISSQKWVPAINRLKKIVEEYDETIFIEEALHRLIEIYYKIGLEEEATTIASILGYNYNSGKWYEESYKILNKSYKIKKPQDIKKDDGLIKRTIKNLLG